MSHHSLANRRTISTLSAAAAAMLPTTGSAYATGAHSAGTQKVCCEKRGPHRQDVTDGCALRDLWVGHIFWVRAVSLAVIDKAGCGGQGRRTASSGKCQIDRRDD